MYPNLNKKCKSKLQTIQNKYIQICLQLNDRMHTGVKEFGKTKLASSF